jgi:replicative DNA helicase
MAKKLSNKFEYNIKFQWNILKFTVTSKYGYKVVDMFKYSYFSLTEQQIIARAIQKFYRRRKRIPADSSILLEELRKLYHTKDYAAELSEDDIDLINTKASRLYKSEIKDPDEIIEKVRLFASYVEFQKALQEVDLKNFESYQSYSRKIQNAINISLNVSEDSGAFAGASIKDRLKKRRAQKNIIPTPYQQMNNLTNAGGYERGSIFTIVDRPKKGKTTALINFAIDYATAKGRNVWKRDSKGKKKLVYNYRAKFKRVIYFDLENGQDAINSRIDQSIIDIDKKTLLSGDYDDVLMKRWRKWRKLGADIYVIKMPNGCTTDDLQKEMDNIKNEQGIIFDVAFIDYIGIMGSTSGKKEDLERISDAYLDVKNWAKKNDLDIVWTGHHINRQGYSDRATKYKPEHLAKCIDITRHIDGLFGFQQTEQEEKEGIARLEILEQRDGQPYGRIWFWVNINHQKIWEFNKKQIMSMEGHLKQSNKRNKKRIRKKQEPDD